MTTTKQAVWREGGKFRFRRTDRSGREVLLEGEADTEEKCWAELNGNEPTPDEVDTEEVDVDLGEEEISDPDAADTVVDGDVEAAAAEDDTLDLRPTEDAGDQ